MWQTSWDFNETLKSFEIMAAYGVIGGIIGGAIALAITPLLRKRLKKNSKKKDKQPHFLSELITIE
jgi:gas vesicle protein